MRVLIFLLIIGSWLTSSAGPLSGKQVEQLRKKVQSAPDQVVTENEVAVIETSHGTIIFEFFPLVAPIHAMNFKKLASVGFYDSTTFHRIVPGFVIQGGDILSRDDNPSNDGTGSTGYTLPAEFGKKHLRGAVAAARMADQVNPRKESSGCQFYICLADHPFLDKAGYTVFGQVIKGLDVVDKIARVDRDRQDRPLKDVIMLHVYVTDRNKLNLK